MGSEHLMPNDILDLYEVHEWRNACAVLAAAHSREWNELLGVLMDFRLRRSDIVQPGGRKSPIASSIDSAFYRLGWQEKSFDTKIIVDGEVHETPTHSVDCYKDRVALEVEWNNKDPFFDRDLNNFRLLFELRAIDVGVIVTRCDELQGIFDALGKGDSYGASTTHMSKLVPRIEGGGGGGCPILVFGIRDTLYDED
ncbi:MAG: restriction endonuclease [Firmicutes bacterium]|nr:restriction endonuclease [Bacillota bacterium]